jgi:hypothetical protein
MKGMLHLWQQDVLIHHTECRKMKGMLKLWQQVILICRKPPRDVPYKCTYVPYDGTFGEADQGQTLDV